MPTKPSQFVDLFGNSTLTPRQIAQQQISQTIEEAQASFAGHPASVRTAATFGAGLGGLFRQTLMDSGVIAKDPEQARAEKLGIMREEVNKLADDHGINAAKDMDQYADLVAGTALKMGMEDVAARAVQQKLLLQAAKRTAAVQESVVTKNLAGAKKDVAEADKAEAEAKAAPEMNAAKLDLLQNQAHLAKVKAAGLQVLTSLKQTDPNRAKVQKWNEIIADVEKNGGKISPKQRKILDEYAKVDPINRMLGQTLGGGGGVPGGMNDKPEEGADHFDFSGNP